MALTSIIGFLDSLVIHILLLSSSTPIYRYANFIDNTGNTGQPVSTSASNASAIPTTLVFEDISENDTENILYRDSVGTAVNENETVR